MNSTVYKAISDLHFLYQWPDVLSFTHVDLLQDYWSVCRHCFRIERDDFCKFADTLQKVHDMH